MGDVAADELAAQFDRRVHHHEAAGGGADDQLPDLCSGRNQSPNQPDRLDVWIHFAAFDFFGPTARDAVISPSFAATYRWFLQHEQIVAAPAAALAHAHALRVPGEKINRLELFADAQVVGLT